MVLLDVVVIGAGVAGLEAAHEASRNRLKVMVIDDQPEAPFLPTRFKEGKLVNETLVVG